MCSQLLQVQTVSATPSNDPNLLNHTVEVKQQEQALQSQGTVSLETGNGNAQSIPHPLNQVDQKSKPKLKKAVVVSQIKGAFKKKKKSEPLGHAKGSTTPKVHPPTAKEMQAFQKSLKDNAKDDGILPRSGSAFPLLNNQNRNKNSPPIPVIGPPVGAPLPQWAEQNGSLSNASITSQQLGLSGPFSGGITYNSVTGLYLHAQYILPLSDQLALGLLGEYGPGQYRLNGTIGYGFSPLSQIKVSAEYLAQRLPFQFDSGSITQRVHQFAYGVRYQQLFEQPFLQNINLGGYYASAASKDLSPVIFTANGLNYLNERRIAGANSAGIDMGTEVLLSPKTSLDGNIYFDRVHYDTKLTGDTSHNRQGLGAGVKLGQLFGGHFKLWGEASVRKIYDSYGGGVSWLPAPKQLGIELSVVAQHFVSHDGMPNSNSVGLQVNLLPDANSHYDEYFDWKNKHLPSISQWVQTPAVYMDQVLAVAEQTTRLLPPGIASISPNNGPAAGGNTVTITGSNFIDGLKLFFGGHLASGIDLLSTTTVTAKVPPASGALASKPVDVVIENPDGQQATLNNGYTYNSLPSITSIEPSQGPSKGGTLVTIIGTHLTGVIAVTFDGQTAAIQSSADNKVTVSTPPHAAGAVDVVVTTPDGSVSKASGYTYVAAPTISDVSPHSGPTAGGTQVVITGTDLSGATAVTFDGQTAAIQSATDNKITVSTPAHAAGSVDVVVTTPGGSVSKASGYTYVAAPTISDVSPHSGPTAGGTQVVITGTDLSGATAVTFGGIEAAIQSHTDNKITVSTPPHVAGSVDVVVTTPGGSASKAGGYTYVTVPPTISSIEPTSGPASGGTIVRITGADFDGVTRVTFFALPGPGGYSQGATILSATSNEITILTPSFEIAQPPFMVGVEVDTPNGIAIKKNGYTFY